MKKFAYKIESSHNGNNCHRLEITTQDSSIKPEGIGKYDDALNVTQINGWKIRVSNCVEVRPDQKIVFLVGSSGASRNHYDFRATPAQLADFKKTLEKFRTDFCGHPKTGGVNHNHPLTHIFV